MLLRDLGYRVGVMSRRKQVVWKGTGSWWQKTPSG